MKNSSVLFAVFGFSFAVVVGVMIFYLTGSVINGIVASVVIFLALDVITSRIVRAGKEYFRRIRNRHP